MDNKETSMESQTSSEPETMETEAASQKTSFWRELLSWLEIIVAAVLISLFLTRVVLINAEVPSSSMENLIKPDDRLFGNRLAYKFSDPQRFDVIIFKYPVDESENYIKRIIGLPGETVEIRDAKIYIDGSDTPLNETYLPEKWVVENDGLTYEVPEDCYFVLGDNRNISEDARYWAEDAYLEDLVPSVEEGESYTYVRKDQILGKAMFTYWPHFKKLSDYTED